MSATQNEPVRLFVYGTLMPGHRNFAHIRKYVQTTQPASMDGILLDLGSYPALIHGDGIVRGVLLEMDQEALAVTDRIEGYHADSESSLFIRKEVSVQLDEGQSVSAWSYFFADAESIIDRLQLIVGHDVEGRAICAWRSKG